MRVASVYLSRYSRTVPRLKKRSGFGSLRCFSDREYARSALSSSYVDSLLTKKFVRCAFPSMYQLSESRMSRAAAFVANPILYL